ncbi:MAG: T9SS type A sorting domain-containing protein, partial [Bacteroidota bacterium]
RTGNSQDFAESIAIDGDGTTLAVRNSGFDQFNSAVYMFTREGETWTERQFLRPSDAAQSAGGRGEEFGTGLALTADGRFLIATAPEHRDFPVTYGGTAYVFDAGDSSTWTEALRTTVIDNGNENGCGSVALSADGATTLFGCTGYQETFTDPAGAGAVLSGIAVSSEGSSPGATLTLAPPVPNPASGPVALSYSLSAPGTVRLSVYDALGREVAVVASAERSAGRHTERLDTSLLAPGVYVARLSALGGTRTRRLTIVR